MLQRAAKTIKQVAESAGIVSPSVSDATPAAETHRRNLVAAQTARENAEQALQAGHDRGADDGEIERLEAVLAAAKVDEARAEARFRAGEKRLSVAVTAEREKARGAAIVKRDQALATIKNAATRIDELAREIAAQAQVVDGCYPIFNESQRDGVASSFTRISGAALAQLAIERTLAEQSGHWVGDRSSAADAAARVTGAIRAGDES